MKATAVSVHLRIYLCALNIPIVDLAKKIPEQANAYARSSIRDAVAHVLLDTRLANLGEF